MHKILITSILVFLFASLNAQVKTIPNDFKTPKSDRDKTLGGLDDKGYKTFNNINHPLSITGGVLTLGGAATYIVGSEVQNNHQYSPKNATQFVGIGVFATGAVLFAIFATERDENVPKRKRKKSYNATDWEVTQ